MECCNLCNLQRVRMINQRTIHRQLIDDQRNFHRDAIEKAVEVLGEIDRQYFSVAIIGVQNSGKSTLLNHLFGTNFEVLKEGNTGNRTTRGILVSVDESKDIIIYDVEGNDAMDRSEEQDYEKMVSTYALVTANILIINIWSKTIGQHTGSQYETLKVIMEICMDQFKQESPKTILFCVRDFNEEYDDEGEITRKLKRDVNDIWRKLQKPEEMKAYDNKPEKLFNVEVFALARYRSGKTGKFEKDVERLRERFTKKEEDEYYFRKMKSQFNLPVTDLPQLSQNAWSSIKTNQKLNLPSQKEQLASFRCSTIMSDIELDFEHELKKLEEEKACENFGNLKSKYLEKYDRNTYHYGKDIADDKRHELETGIDDNIKKIINEKMIEKTNDLVNQFVNNSKLIKNNQDGSKFKSFDEELKGLIDVEIEEFVGFMKKMGYEVPNRKERINQLTEKLNDKFKDIKSTILQLSREQFENETSRTVRLLASEVLKEHFGDKFWKEAMSIFNKNVEKMIEKFQTKYNWITGEEMGPVEYDFLEEKVTKQFKDSIKSELQKTLTARMIDHFNKMYNHDEEGNTINFNLKTEDEIGKHFDQTRDKIVLLIRKLNNFTGSSIARKSSLMEGLDDQYSFFESTWLASTVEQIEKSMRSEFEKTIRRKKEGEMNTVPWWLYLIIFFFVYDDLWFTQADNPIIHYTLALLVIIPLLFFAIGQGRIVKESIRLLADKLKQVLPFLR